MNTFLISIIMIAFVAFLPLISRIDCDKQISKRYSLRKFGLNFGELQQKLLAETLQQKINLEIENLEQIMRMEKKLIEEARRRRIYEKYLLKYQQGSSVLTDFHSNLF
jgi:hypothetical protein